MAPVPDEPTNAPTDLTGAKRRIIERLKRADVLTASELAGEFGLSDTALRQHLEALAARGLVQRVSGVPAGRGRPAVQWRLAAAAAELFPDRHAELTVDLIEAIRSTLGDEALRTVIEARAERQLSSYRRHIVESAPVPVKVRALARLRSAEGYMAEAVVDGDPDIGSSGTAVTLIEHHCPIADAAGACAGLCDAELELFRRALGPAVRVERAQHLLAGSPRCAYRIVAA